MHSNSIPDTLKQVLTSRIALFVGAGVSFGSGLPDFQALSQAIIRNIASNSMRPEEIEFLSQNLRPEVILQISVDELGSKALRSLHVLSGHKPNPNHFFLAEALRQGKPVFTTNVDNLIETACESRSIEFERCYDDRHFAAFVNELSNPDRTQRGHLFKLHGTIEEDKEGDDRYKTILVALNQVGRGLSEPKETVLEYFLEHFDFCFMGYSCQDDFSVLPVLMNTASDKMVYWLSSSQSPLWQLKSENELSLEKEQEEHKAPGDKRSWKTINVNSFLLKHTRSSKIVGDWPKFVKDTLCPVPGMTHIPDELPHEGQDEEFNQWIAGIDDYKRKLTIGRLYHSLYHLQEAESYYRQALAATNDDRQKATAGRRLGDIYLIPSTREGDEKAIEAFRESVVTSERLSDLFGMASAETDLGNALRRRRRFPEAQKYVQDARDLLENRILPSDQTEIQEHQLAYARCLNVMGLIHFGLGSEDDLRAALDLCEKSKQTKEIFGDVDGIAESENAMGLILGEQGRILANKSQEEAARRLGDAVSHLQKAIASREKIGNYRGCFQHCRNLGLAHSRLANLSKDSGEKERYVRLSKKDYQDGMSYLNKTRPEPPPGEILECQFRLGELCVQLGEREEAIRWLEAVELKRREPKEWHNRARTLDLLRKAYADTEQKKHSGMEIMSIYRDVRSSTDRIWQMKDDRVKVTNARDILRGTAQFFDEIGLAALANEARLLSEELARKVADNGKT